MALDGCSVLWSNHTPSAQLMKELVEVAADQPAAPRDGEFLREGDTPASAGGGSEGDVAVIVSLNGLNPSTLFEIIEQLSDELIQQAEAAPLAVTAVAGLVGGVALGQVVPGDVAGKLPEDGI